ncbi:MAG TPA: sigma-70 family RNA polymerase sigma factor [Planctomicrobium sp.]|nr:sigma-70 family RNA polymerase sigma factor [Planctomicrobium sp.]
MLELSTNQELLDAWQAGNEHAAQVLYQRYMVRLTALARSKLSRKLVRRLDPDDIVLSAWRSFFVAVNAGRVLVPEDDNLWPLLVTLTMRKLSRQAARHVAQRRNMGKDLSQDDQINWQQIFSREPSPQEAAMVVDEVESLLSQLDATDREVLSRRLQGEQQSEIAAALNCSDRTVRRSLQRIRERFLQQDDTVDRVSPRFPSAEPIADDAAVSNDPISSATITDQKPTIDYRDLLLKKLIGQGAFGKVYQAFQWSTQSIVAVKFLKKRFWNDPRAVRSLLNEVSQAASLSHPHMVRSLGWGHSPHGAPFLVMEWINGSSLQELLNNHVFDLLEILKIGRAVADAVAAAHAIGIVHGDITPSNVLLSAEGVPFLTDFGFARSLSQPQRSSLGGTPGFLAPEQISDAFGPVNERTDVYGWGGLMHALITGHPPWTGSDLPDILAKTLSSQTPPPIVDSAVEIPKELHQLIRNCLSKEPSERPATMNEVRDVLQFISNQVNLPLR